METDDGGVDSGRYGYPRAGLPGAAVPGPRVWVHGCTCSSTRKAAQEVVSFSWCCLSLAFPLAVHAGCPSASMWQPRLSTPAGHKESTMPDASSPTVGRLLSVSDSLFHIR